MMLRGTAARGYKYGAEKRPLIDFPAESASRVLKTKTAVANLDVCGFHFKDFAGRARGVEVALLLGACQRQIKS